MTLDERLQQVAVLGAGGKMGSGISLLLAREMALQQLDPANAGKTYRLILMDIDPAALEGLQQYLRRQAEKYAQKNAASLPGGSSEAQFVDALMGLLDPVTSLEKVGGARMVFEAILEKLDLKVKVFRQLKSTCAPDTYYFSNTSSIPLKELDEQVGLDGRIIGFHFYNPPAVQRLVELIIPERVQPELPELSRQLGQRLGKIIIPANDVAGFIGNGHFMRDGLYGIHQAEELAQEIGFVSAVYAVNRISQDFLVRPMGIFQLIDYVGLDIFQSILKIMNPHFPAEKLHSELIDTLVTLGVKGGQFSDGAQKDGFFQYDGGRPVGVFDLERNGYSEMAADSWQVEADRFLGPLPEGHAPWKALLKAEDRAAALERYFANLVAGDTRGARLATAYLKNSKKIGEALVSGGVAHSAKDVNGVLMNGFFHLYGPVNAYV